MDALDQLKILWLGAEAWNKWRDQNDAIEPDFSGANLSGWELSGANLSGANLYSTELSGANFSGANLDHASLHKSNLYKANLSGANLRYANLSEANLSEANLRYAKLDWANLLQANLRGANLSRAKLVGTNLLGAKLNNADLNNANLSMANLTISDLTKANLTKTSLVGATLIETKLEGADFSNSTVHGISAWNLKTNKDTKQINLVITKAYEPIITVDNLEVSQFIYLLLNNEKVRDVIETIGKKAVLILGRFTKDRKTILDLIKDELRAHDYLPILFDFEKPTSKDLTETVSTLAHIVRFIIADITEPRSIPHELATIVPTLSVPVQPLLLEGSTGEYAMFHDLRKYDWVLSVHRYKNITDLLESFGDKLIFHAEKKAKELIMKKQ
jgi:hypothetical protein